jgi:hypothetical protein
VRFHVALIILVGSLVLPRVALADAPAPLAVIDPQALRDLDRAGDAQQGFGLGRMLDPSSARTAPIANDALFALPAMAGIRAAIDAEFHRFIEVHKADRGSVGVGAGHDVQLFDRALLYSATTRFVLAGIVNRMDRAYVAPDTCGEIRLIYRLTRIDGAEIPRLPMTLNLVLNARNPTDTSITCAEIARRWLAAAAPPLTRLTKQGGALASVTPRQIDRIETNLQIAHTPKSEARDFRTDYLQKVFRFDAAARTYEPTTLEDQIDRDRILADDGLARDFKSWLLDPKHLSELDSGTILIPEKFLATGSVAATPAGFATSPLQPAYGLMQSDGTGGKAVFTDDDVVTALAAASARGIVLQNIRSPAGFERRLNDISCGGCHQTRGIGGFHFPGVDTSAFVAPASAGSVPGSPHFVGDQSRRRDIAMALRDGRAPDFSRGFSDRPQLRGDTALAGTEYLDGWGATCYRRDAGVENDSSFASWSCAEGLACQPVGDAKASRIGMCFVK